MTCHDPFEIRCTQFGIPSGVKEWSERDQYGNKYPPHPVDWSKCTCEQYVKVFVVEDKS